MHDLLLELCAGERLTLAQLPLDGGALVAAFAPSPARHPRWIAKTAHGPAACRRLRAEAEALRALAPLAAELHIPQLLAWRDSESGTLDDARACLVQTPIPGSPLPAPTAAVCDWLRRWQLLAPQHLRPLPALAELAASTVAEAQAIAAGSPELAPLLSWIAIPSPLLAPAGSDASASWTHGDFWSGNILWTPARRWPHRAAYLGVVDWSGLGPGSALDDLLNWMIHGEGNHPWPLGLLAGGPRRQLLRDWARRAGYSHAVARFAFYLFLARRLLWELGFALQARSAGEQAQARAHWTPLLATLAHNGYPDPFTAR